MRLRLFGTTYIFGTKAKAAHREKMGAASRILQRMVLRNADASKPIDTAVEFADFFKVVTSDLSPLTADLSTRDRIIAVTSLLAELLRFVITLKMAASNGSLPSRTALSAIFDPQRTLGSFGDRISFCSAFGLLSPEVKGDLGILRDIRNKIAAHSFIPISFDDEWISEKCSNLVLHGKLSEVPFKSKGEARFVSASQMIMILMFFRVIVVSTEHKALRDISDEIVQNSVKQLNDTLRPIGWPEITLPQDAHSALPA